MSRLGYKSAFPRPAGSNGLHRNDDRYESSKSQEGMTTRTWLAGEALKGLLSSEMTIAAFQTASEKNERTLEAKMAEAATSIADARLAELEKEA